MTISKSLEHKVTHIEHFKLIKPCVLVIDLRLELHAVSVRFIYEILWRGGVEIFIMTKVIRVIIDSVEYVHHSVSLQLTVLPADYPNIFRGHSARVKGDLLLTH